MKKPINNPTQQITDWLTLFGSTLEQRDFTAAVGLFAADSYWRDLIAFTWNIKTAEGQADIGAMLTTTVAHNEPSDWCIDGEAVSNGDLTEAWFTFETVVARGQGHIRLKEGLCHTLLTAMQELKGFEEKKGRKRVPGIQHVASKNRKNWLVLRQQEEAELGYNQQPYCVIIGGGQGGIALAARLRRLSVPTIIVEKNEQAGDSWRNRYDSLCLHDQVWQNDLPYLPYPDDWPVFIPKDKMGDWLEVYTKIMELNYWHSTECKGASYNEETGTWQVTVERKGEIVVLQPKQLVLATGMSGMPKMPDIPGANTFKGTLIHSSLYTTGREFKRKQCVVLGSNNSAHDICADLWENDADVTMVQRTSTLIARSETLFLGSSYSEDSLEAGLSMEQVDMIAATTPYGLMHISERQSSKAMQKQDADFYKRLTEAGFLIDFGDDASGLYMKYVRRGSGYYIDVGASDLIIQGEIKLRSSVSVARITADGVILTDGSELPADLIVCATGYGSMNGWAGRLISQDVADKVGQCWGLGSKTKYDPGPWEGELRNMWKPTQQPGLWFHGGNLQQSRFYSQHLSLQIKARMAGISTPVYGMEKVHHLG
jgi:putative flavoprotein involved in K+ transport